MRVLPPVLLLAAVCGCGREPEATQSLGPDAPSAALAAASYDVVKIPASLGGTQSRGMAINAAGLVAGWSNLSSGSRHAAVWRDGVISDLRTLGGPSSTVPWPGLNDDGMVVGISHTDRPDPLHEDWSCDLGDFLPETTDLICSGFVYDDGRMRELPTLGGNHSFAAGVNSRGEIVGWAETAEHDSTCVDAQVLGFRGVDLGSQERQQRQDQDARAASVRGRRGLGRHGDQRRRRRGRHLGRLRPGRRAASALAMPSSGARTTSRSRSPTSAARAWHTPMDINAAGDVVGFSNPPGPGDPEGEFIAQAFFWPNGASTATPIGTLDDDALSEAFAINAHRQVVGVSFGGTAGSRAFLWQNNVLTNLNDLVDIAPDVLLSAQDINDEGQITGRVLDGTTGQVLMFIATPAAAAP